MAEPHHTDSNATDVDRVAMERLANGEDLALNELMERWRNRLVGYLFRFTGNEAAALDLAEETFVQLYLTRSKYQSSRAFPAWLFGIATNLARNHLRWHHRHPTLPIEEAPDIASGEDPAENVRGRERAAAVRTAIDSLPSDLREALLLSEYEGLAHAEIAAITGGSTKAVERRLSRARELLRNRLSRYLLD
jgi:RNA polymerase sigma factor (sigma-70 family)